MIVTVTDSVIAPFIMNTILKFCFEHLAVSQKRNKHSVTNRHPVSNKPPPLWDSISGFLKTLPGCCVFIHTQSENSQSENYTSNIFLSIGQEGISTAIFETLSYAMNLLLLNQASNINVSGRLSDLCLVLFIIPKPIQLRPGWLMFLPMICGKH